MYVSAKGMSSFITDFLSDPPSIFISITKFFSNHNGKSRYSIPNTFISLLGIYNIGIRINNSFVSMVKSSIFIISLIIFYIFPIFFSSDLTSTLSLIILVSFHIYSSIFETYTFLLHKSKNCVCFTYYSY